MPLSLPSSVYQQHPSPSSTSSPAPSAIRIRENQRRSRARRKEYLQEMEQKLKKCEQAGIKASVDMQLAARGVAEENKRLREENGRLREEGEMMRRENQRMRAILDGNQQRCAEPSFDEECNARTSSRGSEHANPEAPSQLHDSSDRQAVKSTTTIEGGELHTQLTPTQSRSSSRVSDVSQNNKMMLGDDTSSCEYAAHIITSMRADISTDDVRADLGCSDDFREWRKCKVDNSKLFVAVDRYTG